MLREKLELDTAPGKSLFKATDFIKSDGIHHLTKTEYLNVP